MSDSMFEINVLPAAEGDCIHLRFQSAGQWYNIVIDSGPESDTNEDTEKNFSELMTNIKKRGEHIDLLCFSHVDDDHIKAAEICLGQEEGAAELIKRIWINIPEWETACAQPRTPSYYCATSADSAIALYEYILGQGIPCDTRVLQGHTLKLGDVTITAVLPTEQRIRNFEGWWKAKRPQQSYFVQTGRSSTDNSPTNGSSIVLLICNNGEKMLFGGDAFASDLRRAAEIWAGDGFSVVKLPHHGSGRNITKIMLKKMKCKYFIISADGSEKRPAQRTIDLLGEYGRTLGGITLYGNYMWDDINIVDGVTHICLTDEAITIEDIAVTIRTER